MSESQPTTSDADRPGPLTVVFMDVEGSTRLRTELGDSAANDLLKAHERIVRHQVAASHGREIEFLGDGFVLAFGDARDAIWCAVRIQRGLLEQSQLDSRGGVRVRMGMSRGHVVEESGRLRGSTVHAASRISAKARGGQVLIPELLVPSAAGLDGVSLRDRGLYWLKGFPERWRLFEVVWGTRSEDPGSGTNRTPYVGRESERADLRRGLEEALSGHGSLVLIGGEPGIGKTRLAEQTSSEADAQAARVFVGRCSEAEGSLPYLPWVEILEAVLAGARSPDAFREVLGDSAAEVARLLPELRRAFPDIPPPLDLPVEQERRYLFNSIREFLERAAQIEPIVLVLDDLQWADEPSILLLAHLAQALPDLPVLIIGTYREDEAEENAPFSHALAELVRQRMVHRLVLRPFEPEQVGAMLTALAEHTPPPALVQVIFAETEGNPFFVEEVFQHLVEEGKLLDDRGRWREDVQVGETEVPKTVRLVIGRRLERLSDRTRDVLAMASVIGRSFEVDVLARASDIEGDPLLDVLDEAERTRLIRLKPGALEWFSFAHELIRQTLLAEMLGVRRQRAHLRVAAAIEERYAGFEEEHASDLAYHLTKGGSGADVRKLRGYLVAAGRRALAASAFETALGHFDAASHLPWEEDQHGHASLLYERGLALRSLQRWDEVVVLWYEAVDAFEKLGDREAAGHVCSEAAVVLGWAAHWEEALIMAGRGLAALEGSSHPDHARLLAITSLMFATAGYRDAADSMLSDAHRLSVEIGGEEVAGAVMWADVIRRWEYMQYDEAADAGQEAIEVLRRSGALWRAAETSAFVCHANYGLGRWEEARRLGTEALELTHRLGNAQAQFLILRAMFGMELCQGGDLERFRRAAQEDLELCRAAELFVVAESYVYLSEAEYLLGNWNRAVELAEEAVPLEEEGTMMVGWHRGHRLRMLACVGERDRTLGLLEDPVIEFPPRSRPSAHGTWVFFVCGAEALWELGERARLASLYPVIEELTHVEVIQDMSYRMPETLAGCAAAAGRSWATAEGHFEKALHLAASLPHRIERPEILRAWARTLLERAATGDAERARGMLEDALADYRSIGMRGHARRTEDLLRDMDRDRG